MDQRGYRGRIAPTPTGYLHLGHAATFRAAWGRAREAGGTVVFRNEDLDPNRCKPQFAAAALEDLRWLGLDWDEGPDLGGPYAPYDQSARLPRYRQAWDHLRRSGWIYPCNVTRKQLRDALDAATKAADAAHPAQADDDEEPVFPSHLRAAEGAGRDFPEPGALNWRFRVPDGREIVFDDSIAGRRRFVAGFDFGDFLVWRKAGVPSYELAVVVDDIAMEISEVVRGADLLKSTARQILLYEALESAAPAWRHCPLILDEQGRRLAKRHDSLSLRALRQAGTQPGEITKRLQNAANPVEGCPKI